MPQTTPGSCPYLPETSANKAFLNFHGAPFRGPSETINHYNFCGKRPTRTNRVVSDDSAHERIADAGVARFHAAGITLFSVEVVSFYFEVIPPV